MDDLESTPTPAPAASTPPNEGSGASLVERVKAILFRPKETWGVIDAEPATIASLYRSWVIPLSAIPVIAMFIGFSIFGVNLGFVSFRIPIVAGLTQAAIQYGLGLLSVYIVSLIIDALAPSFDGTKNPVAAFKVVAYSATAGWVAGIFAIIPMLSLLGLLGLYSLYLFWIGLPRLMRVPEAKAPGYVIVVIIAAIVASYVCHWAAQRIVQPMIGYPGIGSVAVDQATVTVPGVGSVDVGKMEDASKKMQADVAAMQSGTVKAVPADQLQAMLPAAIGAYARTGVSSASMGAGGLGGSNAEGTYKSGDQEVKLELTDMGAAGAIAGLASAMNVNSASQNENGYERTATVDGRMTTEKWDKSSNSGEYGVLVARQFMVKASGQAPIDTLKQAVASVDLAKLEGLARH